MIFNGFQSSSVPAFKVLSEPRARHYIPETSNGWSDLVTERMQELLRLETGWDGYNAKEVDFTVAYFALSMLNSVCKTHTPPPQIVPGTNGDLQLEWHSMQRDIELHIQSPYAVSAFYQEVNGEPQEVDLKSDFTIVAEWIDSIAGDDFDALLAAA